MEFHFPEAYFVDKINPFEMREKIEEWRMNVSDESQFLRYNKLFVDGFLV